MGRPWVDSGSSTLADVDSIFEARFRKRVAKVAVAYSDDDNPCFAISKENLGKVSVQLESLERRDTTPQRFAFQ